MAENLEHAIRQCLLRSLVVTVTVTLAIVAVGFLSGCAQVHESTEQARAENAANEAAIQHITVTSDSVIPGHPSFERLGNVGGHCSTERKTEEIDPVADYLRRNAYLKFGEAADGVIEAQSRLIELSRAQGAICEASGSTDGEYYCCGVAVHFVN